MLSRLRSLAFASLAVASLGAASVASAQPAPQAAAPSGKASEDGKLDVSDLEKKYWASKDVDFSVVQNRAYPKAGRFALAAQYGYFVNDMFSDVSSYRLGLNYYFSERYGMELNYQSFDAINSKSTDAFLRQYGGVMPNHNKPLAYYGASFNWVPIYAKMSLLNSRIVYFDMSFSPGVGMTTYQQQVQNSYPTASSLTFSFDVTQHFFLSKHFALRFDFQNRWYSEETRDFRTNRAVSTETNHSTSLMGGFQIFY